MNHYRKMEEESGPRACRGRGFGSEYWGWGRYCTSLNAGWGPGLRDDDLPEMRLDDSTGGDFPRRLRGLAVAILRAGTKMLLQEDRLLRAYNALVLTI